jgi:hypothetical protein
MWGTEKKARHCLEQPDLDDYTSANSTAGSFELFSIRPCSAKENATEGVRGPMVDRFGASAAATKTAEDAE